MQSSSAATPGYILGAPTARLLMSPHLRQHWLSLGFLTPASLVAVQCCVTVASITWRLVSCLAYKVSDSFKEMFPILNIAFLDVLIRGCFIFSLTSWGTGKASCFT